LRKEPRIAGAESSDFSAITMLATRSPVRRRSSISRQPARRAGVCLAELVQRRQGSVAYLSGWSRMPCQPV